MGSSVEVDSNQLSQVLEANAYLRRRLSPSQSSPAYLHLVDLREALDLHKTSEKISILDYGYGGSPYRSLFPNSKYFRADFTPCDGGSLVVTTHGLFEDHGCPYDFQRWTADGLRLLLV